MGDLVSIALTLYLCLSRGLFSETIALAFLVFLIGKWSKRLSRFSLFLFIGTLACSFMVCQESGGFVWAPGLAFWALRSILSSRPSDQKRPAAWLVLPALVVVSGVTDRDITASALALLLGLAPTL